MKKVEAKETASCDYPHWVIVKIWGDYVDKIGHGSSTQAPGDLREGSL